MDSSASRPLSIRSNHRRQEIADRHLKIFMIKVVNRELIQSVGQQSADHYGVIIVTCLSISIISYMNWTIRFQRSRGLVFQSSRSRKGSKISKIKGGESRSDAANWSAICGPSQGHCGSLYGSRHFLRCSAPSVLTPSKFLCIVWRFALTKRRGGAFEKGKS
jgi:hypothetical protein